MSITCPEHQRGFGIIAAIVILVILAGLSAFIVSTTTTQNFSFAQDVQGARALQAARAGIEWATAVWLGDSPSQTTNCPGTTATPSLLGQINNLDGFYVQIYSALTTSSSKNFCRFEATAWPTGMTSSDNGKLAFIERRYSTIIEGN